MEREIHGRTARGVEVGPETRCAHYDTDRDVVALRFACCDEYYPCFRCHDAAADHDAERVSVESSASAVLCGVCGAELTPREFVDGTHECPECGVEFNPGCADHYELYFDFGE
ncbi:CHY zinc finger protein [Halorussus sp. MSC15.2]|uniref:CHY zinc finger protein n=1 Tax=Halorussus sp. MSC15.2 TaxID=2283638 RepID=UPI0013D6285B|nr:CHY zinc finger protein [Halorussus sp. MSC15.2]NEU57973.1 hypothetical protein [Halorussus sp. MSC15.2]